MGYPAVRTDANAPTLADLQERVDLATVAYDAAVSANNACEGANEAIHAEFMRCNLVLSVALIEYQERLKEEGLNDLD